MTGRNVKGIQVDINLFPIDLYLPMDGPVATDGCL